MIKKKLIGFLFGVFSLSLISSASATELKLATFEPPKALTESNLKKKVGKINKPIFGIKLKNFLLLFLD